MSTGGDQAAERVAAAVAQPGPRVPWDTGHLRAGLLTTVVLSAIGGPLAWVLRDGRAAAWVVAGQALVAAFFTSSALAVAWAGRISDSLTLPVALATYVTKVTILGVTLVALRHVSWLDPTALAWSVVAGTVAWTGVQLRRVWTARLYYVDP